MTEKSGCALAVTAGPQNHSGWLNKPEMCLSEDWHISRLTNSSRLSPPVRNANRISGGIISVVEWHGWHGIRRRLWTVVLWHSSDIRHGCISWTMLMKSMFCIPIVFEVTNTATQHKSRQSKSDYLMRKINKFLSEEKRQINNSSPNAL